MTESLRIQSSDDTRQIAEGLRDQLTLAIRDASELWIRELREALDDVSTEWRKILREVIATHRASAVGPRTADIVRAIQAQNNAMATSIADLSARISKAGMPGSNSVTPVEETSPRPRAEPSDIPDSASIIGDDGLGDSQDERK